MKVKIAFIKHSDLILDYGSFTDFISSNYFEDNIKKWHYEWSMLDLSLSPMDDLERRFMRAGHYAGYFKCLESHNPLD